MSTGRLRAIPVATLAGDMSAFARAELRAEAVAKLAAQMKRGAEFPPIVAFTDGATIRVAGAPGLPLLGRPDEEAGAAHAGQRQQALQDEEGAWEGPDGGLGPAHPERDEHERFHRRLLRNALKPTESGAAEASNFRWRKYWGDSGGIATDLLYHSHGSRATLFIGQNSENLVNTQMEIVPDQESLICGQSCDKLSSAAAT